MFASDPYLTYILIAFTVLLSWQAWERPALMHGMIFNATAVWHHRQYYRLISSAFLHADGMHLIFNMVTLYYMGRFAEFVFRDENLFGPQWGGVVYILFYLSAGVVSSLYSLFKHRNHEWYNALGASGATSAVMFAFVLFAPTEIISFFFFIRMPAWLFGIVYLGLSYFLARRGGGNIGHDAHFWGGLYGFLFLVVAHPWLFTRFIGILSGNFISGE
ncbi:MAG: rhomboid family intramembrane serine protease [Bacteroidia bacterium]|jgi:membrane associated rhomboid family serine protease|nr:rhomboid family intramembrane serine protease [Bacteroidia bacterium]